MGHVICRACPRSVRELFAMAVFVFSVTSLATVYHVTQSWLEQGDRKMLDGFRSKRAEADGPRVPRVNLSLPARHSQMLTRVLQMKQKIFDESETSNWKWFEPNPRTPKERSGDRKANITDENFPKPACKDDSLDMPYLQSIMTRPPVSLTPTFNPFITSYEAAVPYDTLLIKIWAFPKSCRCEAKIDDRNGNSSPSNYSLGVGFNRITIVIIDATLPEPGYVSSYTIHIRRLQLPSRLFLVHQPHKVCGLKQDCSFQYAPGEPCGLQKTQFSSWLSLQSHLDKLPVCQQGDAPGRWILPCNRCEQNSFCFWQEAIWQPEFCQHRRMKRSHVQKCFAGKKVLFIGDSTNRGIMHYIIEQVNETLLEWDKTHDLKVYSSVNHERTTFSFAYYPQFWLPVNHRPLLDKALYQLIKKTGPLENSSNTVLVMGGVHWLANHHIDIIIKALQRKGLEGIRLIIKDLGSGFHQPVEGLRCLSKKEQQKLLVHNRRLTEYAHLHGFGIVETFNMTMARYRDFLQGQCACHFHRVVPVKRVGSNSIHSNKGNRQASTVSAANLGFHVEGDISQTYSEILMNQICFP